jgi:apolipoprotein N-acyltransferase
MKPNKLSTILFFAWPLGAVVTFHLAYFFQPLAALVGVALFCLLMLSRAPSGRIAFYTGIAAGMAIFGLQLAFFFGIFSIFAIFLWFVLAFWTGVFALLVRTVYEKHGKYWVALLAPFLWTGLEYFRSELYPLRFAWVNAGFAFSDVLWIAAFRYIGVYGAGFILMAAAAGVSVLGWKKAAPAGGALLAILIIISNISVPLISGGSEDGPLVVGVQMEDSFPELVVMALDRARLEHPDADFFVLNEYTFFSPVPEPVKKWCKENGEYLIVGAIDWVDEDKKKFYNTAFVIGPDGETVFKQVKSVPIQFFADGLPAKEQKLWESPWGRIGFCVCYDMSYSLVTDRLVRMGAQAIIVPTMDAIRWGRYQHELHARIAPVRAAEYGVPIYRLCSSGISQHVDSGGNVVASAPFPGQGEIMAGRVVMVEKGSLPFDRYLAPLCVLITAIVVIWLFVTLIRRRREQGDKG